MFGAAGAFACEGRNGVKTDVHLLSTSCSVMYLLCVCGQRINFYHLNKFFPPSRIALEQQTACKSSSQLTDGSLGIGVHMDHFKCFIKLICLVHLL